MAIWLGVMLEVRTRATAGSERKQPAVALV